MPDRLETALMWLDSGVSSQIPIHSFFVGEQQLPVSARDLGLFGGFLLALVLMPRLRPSYWWLLGLAPLVIDGANSFAADVLHTSLYTDTNLLRLATGVIAGACVVGALPARPSIPIKAGAAGLTLSLGAGAFSVFWLAGAFATAGVLAMLATANVLAKPMAQRVAWLLALPELAGLALLKQGALALLA